MSEVAAALVSVKVVLVNLLRLGLVVSKAKAFTAEIDSVQPRVLDHRVNRVSNSNLKIKDLKWADILKAPLMVTSTHTIPGSSSSNIGSKIDYLYQCNVIFGHVSSLLTLSIPHLLCGLHLLFLLRLDLACLIVTRIIILHCINTSLLSSYFVPLLIHKCPIDPGTSERER